VTATQQPSQPPSQPPSHVAVAITLNAKASSLKTETEIVTIIHFTRIKNFQLWKNKNVSKLNEQIKLLFEKVQTELKHKLRPKF